MLQRSLILRFVGFFALIYTLLIIPWPGFNAAYDSYFQAMGRAFFASDDGHRVLTFEAHHDEKHPLGTRIQLQNRDVIGEDGLPKHVALDLDTRDVGWVPTALTCALILATPVSWRRRLMALAWGLVWVHVYILLIIEAFLWKYSTRVELASLSSFAQSIADGFYYTLFEQMGASFTIPVFIWVLVTFRRQDVAALSRAMGENMPKGHDKKHLSSK